MATQTLEEKELWEQYNRIARLEAEKFLPSRENGYSWDELRSKHQEHAVLCRQEREIRGMTWTDRRTLANGREERLRAEAEKLTPEPLPVRKYARPQSVSPVEPKAIHSLLKIAIALVALSVAMAFKVWLTKHS